MKNTKSSKGQIVLPAEVRCLDRHEAGQQLEVERLDRGAYRPLLRQPPSNSGLVDWLQSCPEKGFFVAVESELDPFR
jgi:bifunctional DNA-binding transcriptional regulator/antitoxin component of YhaV-PrlF toxin-antitoxin module